MQRFFVGLTVLAIAAAFVMFALHATSERSASRLRDLSALPEPPIEIARDDSLQRLVAVFAIAPDLFHASFGPAVRAAAFRTRSIVGDAFVAPEGTLYVSVSQPGVASLESHFALATLSLGHLSFLTLPPTRAGYVSMVFVGDGSSGLLEADDASRGYRLFSLTPTAATELRYRKIWARPPMNVLASGERCEQPQNAASPFVLYALPTTGNRPARPLVSRLALQHATGGLISDDRLISMYCSTFGGQDFVTMGADPSVVFRLNGNSLDLFSRGRVFASGPRHILIWSTGDDPQGDTGYQDYLDAVK
jgi:hypothetical protein